MNIVRKSLEFKLLAIVLVMLIVGASAVGIMSVSFQRATLTSVTESASRNTAAVVLKDVETTMLEGKADITRGLIQNLKTIKELEHIEVFNHEGREAFNPSAPIKEAATMKEFLTGREDILEKDKHHLTFYLPLKNLPSCQKCHPESTPVIGAVKITLDTQKEYERAMRNVMVLIFATIVGAVIFSLMLWIMLRRMIVRPVKTIEVAASRISEGDLSFNVEVASEDEIGRMGAIFKESFRSLGSILQRIKELSDKIARVSEDMERESKNLVTSAETEAEAVNSISSSMEELNSTAVQIADNTEVLSSSVEDTSASTAEMVSSIKNVNSNTHDLSLAIESTSSSIEELSATIKQVAGNADELAQASEETLSGISQITSSIKEVEQNAKESAKLSEKVTNDAATFGMAAVQKTMEGMKHIKTSVEHTAEFIKKLGGRSDEIGKILTVIDEITDQTTLLALNAAILAAQAGEHGKGFSVVANEIKDLAERTAFSTQEIATLIQSVQQEVKSAVDAMQGGLQSVAEGFNVSKDAEDTLKTILESSRRSSEMARSIERSTTEQAKGARLVTEAMERVKNMTVQIAKATAEESKGALLIIDATERMRDASKQVSRATDEQTASSRQISEAMQLVSERSKYITSALAEHKVGSKHILNSVAAVKSIPVENRKLAFKITNTLRELQKDSELLKTEIERFKFHDERGNVLRLGVAPLEAPATMFKKFTPLVNYLSRKLGRPVELKVAFDFDAAIRDVGQNVTQLCAMGPATYIEANKKYGIRVLATALRNGKPYHRSVLIIRNDADIRSVEDLRGRTFAFGDIQSSTGHIIPRFMLKDAGIDVKDLKYYEHFRSQDDVVWAVVKGDFDAGGVMESTAYKFKDQGLRILKYSDEIPEFNMCYNPTLDQKDMGNLRTAILSLSDSSAEAAMILKSIDNDCTGFAEARDGDYDAMRSKMSVVGIL